MKKILLIIAVVAVVWWMGEAEKVAPKTQFAETNTEATNPEPTKAKATAGVKLWEFETGDRVESSPAIGSDGTVYFGSNDKKLYAINGKSGVKLWEFETGGDVRSSPAIGSDGTVYVGSGDGKLYAIKVPAPGKTFAWTAKVNQQSLDVFYRGKPYTLVQQVFGKPDKTQGAWWGYTGMNITDGQGNKYSTAWFGFSNGVVQQVRFDK